MADVQFKENTQPPNKQRIAKKINALRFKIIKFQRQYDCKTSWWDVSDHVISRRNLISCQKDRNTHSRRLSRYVYCHQLELRPSLYQTLQKFLSIFSSFKIDVFRWWKQSLTTLEETSQMGSVICHAISWKLQHVVMSKNETDWLMGHWGIKIPVFRRPNYRKWRMVGHLRGNLKKPMNSLLFEPKGSRLNYQNVRSLMAGIFLKRKVGMRAQIVLLWGMTVLHVGRGVLKS